MVPDPEGTLFDWLRSFQKQAGDLRHDPSKVGRFFVVSAGGAASDHASFEAAYYAGMAQFGRGRFIVQRLEPDEIAGIGGQADGG